MNALVTGGGGFLGLAIVRQLLEAGHAVSTLQRGTYAELEALGVKQIRGDLTELPGVVGACRNVEVVFHVAAKAGVWGSYNDYYGPNVLGTQNVIAACKAAGVGKLVFTSSPSVVFSGRDEANLTEAAPYPAHYLAHYPKTKAMAEKLVLAANGAGLAAVALRPHLIWGPGDPHLVPRILERARSGRLALVGSRENLVDSTFIENAAAAHVLAGGCLREGAACAGKAYFISNGEPIPMGELIKRILTAAELAPVVPRINPLAAHAAAIFYEAAYGLFRPGVEPPITRFVARQLGTAHWFDLTAARRDLGYEPKVSLDEGMRRLAESLRSRQLVPG